MATPYNHFTFSEEMASSLTLISHSPVRKRFFKATGEQKVSFIDDCLSQVDSAVLIAVDQADTVTQQNGADFLQDENLFMILIVMPTKDADVSTIDTAVSNARAALIQIRNVLIQRYGTLAHNFHLYPSGQIGDCFHGMAMDYTISHVGSFNIDSTFFLPPANDQAT